MKEITAVELFGALKHWASEAKRKSPSAPPSLRPILFPLSNERTRSIDSAALAKFNSKTVVAFEIRGEGEVGIKTRHVLPVHFAILRALELVPGLRLYLQDDAHKTYDKAKGRSRTKSELIYHLKLRCKKLAGKITQTKVDRILFNAPPDASLHERRTGDYRYIVPSGFVPLRIRKAGDVITQESLTSAVAALITASVKSTPFAKNEFVKLLNDLFAIGDKWHWKELIDRTEEDKERDYRGGNV
jgi:hypothetical protein